MDALTEAEQRRIAADVREDHRRGTCTECWGIGPCKTYAAWSPVIADLPPRAELWPGDEGAWWM